MTDVQIRILLDGKRVARATQPSPREAWTIVFGETTTAAYAWCKANGVRPFGKRTLIISSQRPGRGLSLRDDDRLVFVGDVAKRPDYQVVVLALLPCLQRVGGLAKIEHVAIP